MILDELTLFRQVFHYLAYIGVWTIYQIFKFQMDAFATVHVQVLETMANIAEPHDEVIAAHFRALQKVE